MIKICPNCGGNGCYKCRDGFIDIPDDGVPNVFSKKRGNELKGGDSDAEILNDARTTGKVGGGWVRPSGRT